MQVSLDSNVSFRRWRTIKKGESFVAYIHQARRNSIAVLRKSFDCRCLRNREINFMESRSLFEDYGSALSAERNFSVVSCGRRLLIGCEARLYSGVNVLPVLGN